jgi:HSP20 family protein
MNIAIREPWHLLNRLNRELDGLHSTPTASVAFIPAVDVREEAGRFVVEADLPGVEPAQIEVTAEKGVLTIRGERKAATTREKQDGYERIERVTGSFTRRFTLPDSAAAEAIKARFTNGVLEVSIPKQPEVAATRVVVEAA